ncbi:MAG: FtsX-like permease family protein [Eubacteriales bacterium]|nr:FtsX-like permease family protein [Eubacteriales bacterium]
MKRNRMFFKMLFSSLFRRRSRFLVAILAVAIGATILSGLVTIYYDIPRQLGKEFRSYGANMVLLPAGEKEKLSKSDVETARKSIPEGQIVGMAPYRYQTTNVHEHPYVLAGTDMEEAKKNSPFWYIDGEWVGNGHDDLVMVGKEIAKTMNLGVGDEIEVTGPKYGKTTEATSITDDSKEVARRHEASQKEEPVADDTYTRRFTIGGIVTTGGEEENFIFMDINVLNEMLEDQYRVDIVECSIEADREHLDRVAEDIQKNLDGISARPVLRVTQSQDVVLGKLQALVYIVTVVVLILTMISVTTTMMAVVTERRREIGLKKALGALNREIVKEFVSEGAMLGFFGGVFGVILGFLFAQNVSLSVFGRAVAFQWGLIPITIVVSMVITAIACVIPVRSAVRIEPALVLRGE